MTFFSRYYDRIHKCVSSCDLELSDAAVKALMLTKERASKVMLVGNGGSAAMASHVAVDLLKCAGIRAINFNEADLITCFANDYGYPHWVEKCIEFYADPGDVVILISSSGRSPNIINAAHKAKQMGLSLMTFSGFSSDNPLRVLGDINFWADSQEYNVVEMTHHIWLLALSDKIAEDLRESL
jgi:D-sedoheptulose 7-phosphate isomerase